MRQTILSCSGIQHVWSFCKACSWHRGFRPPGITALNASCFCRVDVQKWACQGYSACTWIPVLEQGCSKELS